jgi:hypothetical protein
VLIEIEFDVLPDLLKMEKTLAKLEEIWKDIKFDFY